MKFNHKDPFQGKTEKQVRDSYRAIEVIMSILAWGFILFIVGVIVYELGKWLYIWN